jgi:hypothetical protein
LKTFSSNATLMEMKKFLFLLLLAPLLWSGVGFAETCAPKNGCEPTDATKLANCKTAWETADTDYNKHLKDVMNPAIDTANKAINVAAEAYHKCMTEPELSPDTQEEEKKREKTCYPPYEAVLIPQRQAKATARKNAKPFKEASECAAKFLNSAILNYVGESTSTFDLNILKASDESKETELDIANDLEKENNILNKILKLLTQVLGTFAVLMMIIGAYFMITSQGDESQLQKGKNVFFYTIIGLLIAFMSFIAVQFIISIIFTSTG